MNFTQEPIFIAATRCSSVFFANGLTRFPWGKTVGTPILVIVLCAISISSMALLLALGLLGMTVSKVLVSFFFQVPEIIFLTTLGLILAQFPSVQRLHGKHTMGFFFILIFLAAIGTLCHFRALSGVGSLAGTLILFVGLLVLVYGLVIFGIGALFKMDWDVIAVASQANVGGNTTAIAAAESLKRPDLLIPGVLVGSLGNALGTYVGFAVAGFL